MSSVTNGKNFQDVLQAHIQLTQQLLGQIDVSVTSMGSRSGNATSDPTPQGNCFGTLGTAGSAGGCIGTFGTYGCSSPHLPTQDSPNVKDLTNSERQDQG